MNPIYDGMKITPGLDLLAKPFTDAELNDVYYSISSGADDEDLLMESATLEEIEAEYNSQGDEMILEAVTVRQFSQTARRMAALRRALNKNFENIEAGEAIIGKVKKSGLFASVTVQIPLSDGQVISIVFHSPDNDNRNILPDDEIIAFRWMLNKRDITQAVSPEEGREVSLEQISKRITQIAAKNSEKFQKRQKAVGKQRAELRTAKADLEIASASHSDLLMDITAQKEDAQDLDEEISNVREQLNLAIDLNARLQAQIDDWKVKQAAAADQAKKDAEIEKANEENAAIAALEKEALALGMTVETIQIILDNGVDALRKVVRDQQRIKAADMQAEEVGRLQRLGTEKVPGIRLSDAEKVGKVWEYLQAGKITQSDWDEYVAELYAGGNAVKPEPEPKEETLEETIKKKFKSRSNSSLKRSLETKKGNIDDETIEYTRRMKEKGKNWKFDKNLFKPKVITWNVGDPEPITPIEDKTWELSTENVKAMSKDEFQNVYDVLEDENYHSQNIVLMAKRFGSNADVAEAESLLVEQEKAGKLSPDLSVRRRALSDKLNATEREQAGLEPLVNPSPAPEPIPEPEPEPTPERNELESLKSELEKAENLMRNINFTGDVTPEIERIKAQIKALEPESQDEPAAIQTLNNIINGDLDDDPDALDKALDVAAEELEEAGLMDQYDELLNEAADHYTEVLDRLIKEAA